MSSNHLFQHLLFHLNSLKQVLAVKRIGFRFLRKLYVVRNQVLLENWAELLVKLI